MEPGQVPGALVFHFTTHYGSDFEGGHRSRSGTTPGGSSVEVPLYAHEVSLDFLRTELELRYTVSRDWEVIARASWELKQQEATVGRIDPARPEETAAMQRNIDLHHRSVTLRGAGDPMVLARRRWNGLWRSGDALALAAGATIPLGRTIENPYLLGDRGVEHLHIQFGTGTVDPLLEVSYRVPLRDRDSLGAFLAARVPFYENRHTFRAATDATVAVSLAREVTQRAGVRVEATAYAQGRGYWDGVVDENTGLLATSAGVGAFYRIGPVSISGDLRYPISQQTFDDGDAFTQGPAVIFGISGRLR